MVAFINITVCLKIKNTIPIKVINFEASLEALVVCNTYYIEMLLGKSLYLG